MRQGCALGTQHPPCACCCSCFGNAGWCTPPQHPQLLQPLLHRPLLRSSRARCCTTTLRLSCCCCWFSCCVAAGHASARHHSNLSCCCCHGCHYCGGWSVVGHAGAQQPGDLSCCCCSTRQARAHGSHPLVITVAAGCRYQPCQHCPHYISLECCKGT